LHPEAEGGAHGYRIGKLEQRSVAAQVQQREGRDRQQQPAFRAG
jgi:hypothetical protein